MADIPKFYIKVEEINEALPFIEKEYDLQSSVTDTKSDEEWVHNLRIILDLEYPIVFPELSFYVIRNFDTTYQAKEFVKMLNSFGIEYQFGY